MKTFAVALLTALCATAQDPDPWKDKLGKVKVGIAQAIDLGPKAGGDGYVFHAELELQGSALAWSIDTAQGTAGVNVHVNAADGSIGGNAKTKDNRAERVALCGIDLKKAVVAALKAVQGTPIEAELKYADGEVTINVRVHDGKTVQKVKVDAATGLVLYVRDDLDSKAPKTVHDPDLHTKSFRVDAADLGPTGRNTFLVLEPRHRLVLEGKDGVDEVRLVVTVLDETREIDGVTTRIVEERETRNGKLVEVSRNFLAISRRTTDVFSFGEEVDLYKDGHVVGHGGAWLQGKGVARFGLVMPGTPLLSGKYYQEIAPGVALDRASIEALTATVETPAGIFHGCLKVRETTPLEPDAKENQFHAPGVGLIQKGELKLVKHGKGEWRSRGTEENSRAVFLRVPVRRAWRASAGGSG